MTGFAWQLPPNTKCNMTSQPGSCDLSEILVHTSCTTCTIRIVYTLSNSSCEKIRCNGYRVQYCSTPTKMKPMENVLFIEVPIIIFVCSLIVGSMYHKNIKLDHLQTQVNGHSGNTFVTCTSHAVVLFWTAITSVLAIRFQLFCDFQKA